MACGPWAHLLRGTVCSLGFSHLCSLPRQLRFSVGVLLLSVVGAGGEGGCAWARVWGGREGATPSGASREAAQR